MDFEFKISTFTIKGQKMKFMLEIQTKFLNLSKIIIRATVKTPAQLDDQLKSYGQKTAILGPVLKGAPKLAGVFTVALIMILDKFRNFV